MGDSSVNTSIDFLNQLRASNNPTDKMSLLLMHILEVQINISQKLDSTIQQTEATRQKVQAHESLISAQDSKIKIQETRIASLETEIGSIKEELAHYKQLINTQFENHAKSVAELKDKNHYLEQWRIDNAIFLSGFQNEMDSSIISRQLGSIYKFSPKDVDYHYSFSIPSARGNKKFHYVVIGFANRQTKSNLFTNKKTSGSLFLRQLIPDIEDHGDTEIFISNRLTKNNLTIQKKMLELKKERKIIRIVYKNCVLHVKLLTNELVPIKSHHDLEELVAKISMEMEAENEPPEEQPQNSRQGDIRKRLESFHYAEKN
jgi:hypothetical protein